MLRDKTPRNKKVKRRAKVTVKGVTQDTSVARLLCVAFVFAILWAVLWGRAWHVQVLEGPRLAAMASRQHLASELVTGQRGDIVDRNGLVLARSAAFKSVFVRPVELEDRGRAARVLANALGTTYAEMLSKVSRRSSFVWAAREVDDRAAARIREAGEPGVYLTTEFSRLYPQRQLAGRLLGFVGTDDQGLEGVERAFNDHLTGQSTRQVVQRDAAGRRLYMDGAEFASGLKGKELRLTLDSQIQFFAEDALSTAVRRYEGTWGGCIVVDVESGDILAWAEYPSFNPNAYKRYTPDMWRNRLAMDALEPGSTAKPFLVAAALEEGVASPDDIYFCENGRWKLHGVTIRDTKKHQWLTLDKMLRYSSNIGLAKLGLKMGASQYHSYLTRLGFGQRVGMPLPGESLGIIRPPGKWREVDLAAASFGQGFATTGVQLAKAYLTLANGGVNKPLRLVLDENAPPAAPGDRVYSEATADQVLAMLRDIVEEGGTGRLADVEGLEVGGKTGTAQKAVKGQRGYGNEYVASFVGLVPALKPRHIIVVAVDNPRKNHFGGVVAAPVFRSVTARTWAYLGLLPEEKNAATVKHAVDGNTVLPEGLPASLTGRRVASADTDTVPPVVPDVVGKNVREAVELFARKGLIPRIQGQGGVVVRQQPKAGAPWPNKINDAQYTLWIRERS